MSKARLPLFSILVAGLIAGALGGGVARADHQAVIVVSGKAGVPVYINGRDATGAMVIGDWGLYRPGHMEPIIVPLRTFRPAPPAHRSRSRHRKARPRAAAVALPRAAAVEHPFYHYFPGGELARPVARPPEPLDHSPPEPAESYQREWTTKSTASPADLTPPVPLRMEPSIDLGRKRGGSIHLTPAMPPAGGADPLPGDER